MVGAYPAADGQRVDLTPLDIACGMPLGKWADTKLPRRGNGPTSLHEAIEAACAEGFGRGPHYVSFSGGGESAMALAVATSYARRHGHPDPVPLTLGHPALFRPEDQARQERVVAHLGLSDWERVQSEVDLDLVGPLATSMLRQVGVLWPPPAHMLIPLMERSRGGVFTLATGITDFFAFWRWAPLAQMLAQRRRPTASELLLLGTSVLPASVRARLDRRRGIPPPMPWLHPAAEKRARGMLSGRQADVPLRFDHAVMTQNTHRCFKVGWNSFQTLGSAVGATVVQPTYSLDVIAGVARAGGWRGFGTRRNFLEVLAGDLLPEDALTRRPPVDTTPVFFGPSTREFARQWSGEGVDRSLVDVEVLRREWLSERPDSRTGCLLQAAWLSEQGIRRGHDDATLQPAAA